MYFLTILVIFALLLAVVILLKSVRSRGQYIDKLILLNRNSIWEPYIDRESSSQLETEHWQKKAKQYLEEKKHTEQNQAEIKKENRRLNRNVKTLKNSEDKLNLKLSSRRDENKQLEEIIEDLNKSESELLKDYQRMRINLAYINTEKNNNDNKNPKKEAPCKNIDYMGIKVGVIGGADQIKTQDIRMIVEDEFNGKLIHNDGFNKYYTLIKLSHCDIVLEFTRHMEHPNILKKNINKINRGLINNEMENKKGSNEYKKYYDKISKLFLKPVPLSGGLSSLRAALADQDINGLKIIIKKRDQQIMNKWAFKEWE